jgi:tRNA A-37 threonylcarbamoyl transferase component Bud32
VAAASDDSLIGQLLGERYRVKSLLGRGGMGCVYRVEHELMKKELALKLLHPELGRIEEVALRFAREAEAAARLDHPNIIRVTDFGRTAEGLPYLVMELLDGVVLADLIRPKGGRRERLPLERALLLIDQVLAALESAHAAGVVHRDLKPENIVLTGAGHTTVKLLDFGIAKITDGSQSGEALTQAGVVFGTPEYLSPEQALGEEADRRADLYATGVMLFEMLAGRRPFEAESRLALLSQHLTQDPPSLASVGVAAPARVEAVLRRALAKKREERYADATQMRRALADASGAIQLDQARRPSRLRLAVDGLVARARAAGVPRPRWFVAGFGVLFLLLVVLVPLAFRDVEVGGSATTLAAPAIDEKQRAEWLEQLRRGKTCKDRREAAEKLVEMNDRRNLAPLRVARDRRGGFLGLQQINGCMKSLLSDAIDKLEAETGPAPR